MRPRLLLLASATGAILLAGCSASIQIKRVDPADPASAVGVPLPLMFTRYEVAASWQLVACKAADGTNTLVVQPSVELGAPTTAPDAANLFVIDPSSLSSPFKTSQVQVEYAPSGAPLVLNAKIEDRSAAVIAGVAALGAGLAKYAAVPLMPASGATAPAVPTCSKDAAQWVADELTLRTKVKADTALLDDRVAALKSLLELVAGLGANVDDATKARLVQQQRQTGEARLALEDSTKRHARALDKVRHRQSLLWPRDGTQLNNELAPLKLPAAVVDAWRAPVAGAPLSSAAWIDSAGLSVYLDLGGRDALANPASATAVRTDLGIPLRLAVQGELRACGGAACKADSVPITRRADRVLQLGPVFYLPCISRAFSSVECSYAHDDAGNLKKAGSVYSNASAETAIGALNDIVKQATEARSARGTAETKRLEAETAYLKAKKALEDAQAPAQQDPQAAIKTESAALLTQAARLDAERALIEAELALAEARQKQPPKP
jgi:hypothetical protein